MGVRLYRCRVQVCDVLFVRASRLRASDPVYCDGLLNTLVRREEWVALQLLLSIGKLDLVRFGCCDSCCVLN